MKQIFVVGLFIFWLLVPTSKAQFFEDFTDGNISVNPTWIGDTSLFTVIGGRLQSNSPNASSNFQIATSSNFVKNGIWEFFVNLQFQTSSANYVDVYLTSDSALLNHSANNAYFVRIGNTKDEICLYKKVGSTNHLLIDGVDGITNTSNNTLKIKVTRDSLYNWQLERDLTGTGNNYFLEGDTLDSQFTQSQYFGMFIQQSTASFHFKHFFDDIYCGPFIQDTIPPILDSLQIISADSLKLVFNEPLNATMATQISNYNISNGIGNPATAAMLLNNKKVWLTMPTPLQPFTNYQLSYTVEDTLGNQITNQQNFSFTVPIPVNYGEVVINEFMADPSPVVGLPEKEFVEIWNVSSKNIQLNGWQLSDATSTTTLKKYQLLPNTYLILCANADTSLFSNYGPTMGLASWPSLNNSSDIIKITDSIGNLIDSVAYTDLWYADDVKNDGGFTLELIRPNDSCAAYNQKWRASNHPDGGTPGNQNSIYSAMPANPAQLIDFDIASNNALGVIFDRKIDSLSFVNGLHYVIVNAQNVNAQSISLNADKSSGIITFPQTFPLDVYVPVHIASISDCYGLTTQPLDTFFGIGVTPTANELLITELFHVPNSSISPNLPNEEFIELYNKANKLLNLEGVTYADVTSKAVFGNLLLGNNERLIVCPSGKENLFETFGKTIGISPWPTLNNTGDNLTLKNNQNQLVFELNYSNNWITDENKRNGGYTLEMKDTQNPCGGENNWDASVNVLGGTPGAVNSIAQNNPDKEAPFVVSAYPLSTNRVQLNSNELLDSNLVVNFGNLQFSENLNAAEITIKNRKNLVVTLTDSLQPKTLYAASVKLFDCAQNAGFEELVYFALPETPEKNDLVINEVLSNPRKSNGADYIEIYNSSSKYLSLQNWMLANWDEEKQLPSSLRNMSTEPHIIFPKSYLFFTTNLQDVAEEYPNTIIDNGLEMSSLPTYSNDNGHVLLLFPDSSIADHLTYDKTMHFALIKDLNGVALERLSADRPTNELSNWTSASQQENFGTPGYKNSQSSETVETTNFLEVNTTIFSPDNDGYNDVITFTYNLPSANWAGSLYVYNAHGVLIKTIVANQTFGLTGNFSWDGISDNGFLAEVGHYVVVLEVFTLTGETQVYKKTFVLAQKL